MGTDSHHSVEETTLDEYFQCPVNRGILLLADKFLNCVGGLSKIPKTRSVNDERDSDF